jgi:hypothetical protein
MCVFIYAVPENGARSGAVNRLCLLNYTVTSSINVVRMLLLPPPYAAECNDLLKFARLRHASRRRLPRKNRRRRFFADRSRN